MSTNPVLRLSERSIRAVAAVLCGDTPPGRNTPVSPYRTGAQLQNLVKSLQVEPSEMLSVSSRGKWTMGWVAEFSGRPETKRIIEAAVNASAYIGTEYDPDEAAVYLREFLEADGLRLKKGTSGYEVAQITLSEITEPRAELTTDYVKEMSAKCDYRLQQDDYEGAITVARTTLEAVLFELENNISGTRTDFGGDLQKQFKAVARVLGIDGNRLDLDENFKQVARGLVQIVNGLASIRNQMSDGHARERQAKPHHARVVVNAAKTVAGFLVDSYEFQRRKGAFQIAAPEGPAS